MVARCAGQEGGRRRGACEEQANILKANNLPFVFGAIVLGRAGMEGENPGCFFDALSSLLTEWNALSSVPS